MPSAMEDVRLEASKTYAIVFTANGTIMYRNQTPGDVWETWIRNCKMKKDMEYEFVRDSSPRIGADGKIDSKQVVRDARPHVDDLVGLTIQDLRRLAAAEGISGKGSKPQIIEAIRDHRKAVALGTV